MERRVARRQEINGMSSLLIMAANFSSKDIVNVRTSPSAWDYFTQLRVFQTFWTIVLIIICIELLRQKFAGEMCWKYQYL